MKSVKVGWLSEQDVQELLNYILDQKFKSDDSMEYDKYVWLERVFWNMLSAFKHSNKKVLDIKVEVRDENKE